MSAPLTRESLQHRADLFLIIAFLALLWLPTVQAWLHFDHTPPPNENRAPAPFPPFKKNLNAIRVFCGGVESWFNDRFGFRSRLVTWERQWKFNAFSISKTKGVIIGRDGWLFYTGGLMVEDITGRKSFTDQELEAWRILLTERRDWLAQRGIRYLFVIPPDKHTIYPEQLPTWLRQSSRQPHRLDQFITHMRAHGDLPILDLRPVLLAAKRDTRVYLQTDTHWNAMGSFAAYQNIVRSLASGGLPVQPFDLSRFLQTTRTTNPGDLANMLGVPDVPGEKNAVFLTPRSEFPLPQVRFEPALLNRQWLPMREPAVAENPSAAGRLLLFRDSFAEPLIPLLAQHFQRTVAISQYNWDRHFIALERPDVVIDEMVERSLIFLDPTTLKAAEDSPDTQLAPP